MTGAANGIGLTVARHDNARAEIVGPLSGGRRARLSDVANLARVTPSTASAALNGGGRVSSATRARVLHAAKELRYEGPDPWALALRKKQTKTICVVAQPKVLRRSPERALQLLDSVTSSVADAGGFVLWIPGGTSRASQLRAVPADGAVVLGETTESLRDALSAGHLRYVALDRDADRREVQTRIAELCSDLAGTERAAGKSRQTA